MSKGDRLCQVWARRIKKGSSHTFFGLEEGRHSVKLGELAFLEVFLFSRYQKFRVISDFGTSRKAG